VREGFEIVWKVFLISEDNNSI